jgi:hypothetical protein
MVLVCLALFGPCLLSPYMFLVCLVPAQSLYGPYMVPTLFITVLFDTNMVPMWSICSLYVVPMW